MANYKTQSEKFNEIDNLVKDTFTDPQKRAILYSLLLIAKSDGEYHLNEHMNLSATAQFLNYIDINSLQSPCLDLETMIHQLNTLNSNQKDWYILSTLGMIQADFEYKEIEDAYANHFYKQMGISEDYVNKLIQKYQ